MYETRKAPKKRKMSSLVAAGVAFQFMMNNHKRQQVKKPTQKKHWWNWLGVK